MDFATIAPDYAPSAWLDMDALDHNIELVNQKTQAVNLRLATKSIRSIDVLRYIKNKSPKFIGLMSYAADESVYLLDNGFDNVLCAYPSLDKDSIAQTFKYTKNGAVMIWMADRIEHLTILNAVGKTHNTQVSVCLDINMSMALPKLYFGTKRSALMGKKDVKKLLQQAEGLPFIAINAVMGYEGQIAGLPEHLPQKPLLAPAIKLLKKQSAKQVSRRRKAVVSLLQKKQQPLQLVNGGGSGSMDFTSSQSEVTEITVGSAYYKPAYFDYMDSMHAFKPAAGFVLQVTRHPESPAKNRLLSQLGQASHNVITCHGGGFIASGASGSDKSPVVHYPKNLTILSDEGFGEVQTPMQVFDGASVNPVKIGDYVWCRHAKAGELCEHFNQLIGYQSKAAISAATTASPSTTGLNSTNQIMTTYRGDGKCFH